MDTCDVVGQENKVVLTTYSSQVGVREGAGGACSGKKRARESEEEKEVEKRGCEEGMSWWTCLMLGMDQENTKPQVVKKLYTKEQ